MSQLIRIQNRWLNRVELVFVALLGLAIVVIWAVQALLVAPARRCEAAGNWWDPHTRICGHVVYLPDITHRPVGSKALPSYPDLPRSVTAAAEGSSGRPAPSAQPHPAKAR